MRFFSGSPVNDSYFCQAIAANSIYSGLQCEISADVHHEITSEVIELKDLADTSFLPEYLDQDLGLIYYVAQLVEKAARVQPGS